MVMDASDAGWAARKSIALRQAAIGHAQEHVPWPPVTDAERSVPRLNQTAAPDPSLQPACGGSRPSRTGLHESGMFPCCDQVHSRLVQASSKGAKRMTAFAVQCFQNEYSHQGQPTSTP